jgi:hypothetical protein
MQSRAKALELNSRDFYYLNHEILFERHQDVVNIADQVWQAAIIRACEQKGIKAVILDKLSCLLARGRRERRRELVSILMVNSRQALTLTGVVSITTTSQRRTWWTSVTFQAR